jgi:hypothetical protein
MRKIGLNILLPFVILFLSPIQLHAQTDEKTQRIPSIDGNPFGGVCTVLHYFASLTFKITVMLPLRAPINIIFNSVAGVL